MAFFGEDKEIFWASPSMANDCHHDLGHCSIIEAAYRCLQSSAALLGTLPQSLETTLEFGFPWHEELLFSTSVTFFSCLLQQFVVL